MTSDQGHRQSEGRAVPELPEALRFALDEQPESMAAALERLLELGRRGEVRA